MSSSTANADTSECITIPNLSSEWNDVTNILSSITSQMELGEMLHVSDFSLHSAMSALEIGDGVLDAAMTERLVYIEDIVKNNELIHKLMNISSNKPMLINILDELIRLLWSFFNGNSDQFSIYSCLYLHEQIKQHPLNTNNKDLNLFIDSIKLCCGYAREIVLLSGIAEDDDWAKQKEFTLNDFTNINNIKTQLQEKINALKNVKLSENSEDKKNENENENKNKNKNELAQAMSYRFEFIAGLLHIMQHMYNITIMLTLDDINIEQKNNKQTQHSPSKKPQHNSNQSGNKKKQHENKKSKTKQTPQRNKKNKGKSKGKNKSKQQKKSPHPNKKKQQQKPPQNKRKQNENENENECGLYIIDCGLIKSKCNLSADVLLKHKTSIFNFKQLSSSLLRIVNHLMDTQMYAMQYELYAFAFDDRLGHHKAVHAPRKPRIPLKLQCFTLFNHWCKCIRFMCTICKVDTFDAFMEYLDAFNNTFGCEQPPNVIIRSFLVIIIEQFAKYDSFLWSGKPLIHFIQKSFNCICEWSRIFPHTNKQYLGDYHTFFSRVETAISDIVRQKLLHVTRQIDWTKRAIKNWQILQTEGPEIDRLTVLSYLSGFDDKYHNKINEMEEYKCCPNPYSSWIIDKCCDSMIHYIFIHLNQQMALYAQYEMEYVYYYLEYLFSTKIQIYQSVSFKRYQKVNLEKLNELINPNYAKMKARKLKKKKGAVYKDKEESKLLAPLDPNDKYIYLMTEAQRCLCLGIFELIQSFYQINKEKKNILVWNGLSDRIDIDEKENDNNNMDNKVKRLGDESLRFAHRFNVFGHVDQPPPIPYQQYRSLIYEYDKNNASLSAKFKQSEMQFDASCKHFGLLLNTQKFNNIASYQQDFITAARKVAIINKIFASKLLKIVQQNKKEQIKIVNHFDTHPFYAVFAIDDNIKPKLTTK